MNKVERQSLAAILLILLIGAGIAWAGSQGGLQVRGIPLFALCGILAFAINRIVLMSTRIFVEGIGH